MKITMKGIEQSFLSTAITLLVVASIIAVETARNGEFVFTSRVAIELAAVAFILWLWMLGTRAAFEVARKRGKRI